MSMSRQKRWRKNRTLRETLNRQKVVAVLIGSISSGILTSYIREWMIPVMLAGIFILLIAFYISTRDLYIHQNLYNRNLKRMHLASAFFIAFEAGACAAMLAHSLFARGII